MSGVSVCLWFNNEGEEAANFYVSVFKACGRSASIESIVRFDHEHAPPGTDVVVVYFDLDGQKVAALNGGSSFKLSPAVSLYVNCKDQTELDNFWNKLLDGGQPLECGWLTDRYGLSWQIVPQIVTDTLQEGDPETTQRLMATVMKMVKLDIATIQAAIKGN